LHNQDNKPDSVIDFREDGNWYKDTAQHSVHPIPDEHRGHGGGSLRVFRQFVWLEAGSVKASLPCPAHQRVTLTVRQFFQIKEMGILDEYKIN
jgi:hypothetical protein